MDDAALNRTDSDVIEDQIVGSFNLLLLAAQRESPGTGIARVKDLIDRLKSDFDAGVMEFKCERAVNDR